MRGRILRYLKYLLVPLVLTSWLGALWACADRHGHHPTHEGQACTAMHSAIGLQAPAKLASVATVLPAIIVAFLAMFYDNRRSNSASGAQSPLTVWHFRDGGREPRPRQHSSGQDPGSTEAMIVVRRAFVRRLWKT